MYVYFDSIVHYTSYVNNVRQIKQIQIHPEPRPTPESLEDCGWGLSNSGWPNIIVITLYKTAHDAFFWSNCIKFFYFQYIT